MPSGCFSSSKSFLHPVLKARQLAKSRVQGQITIQSFSSVAPPCVHSLVGISSLTAAPFVGIVHSRYVSFIHGRRSGYTFAAGSTPKLYTVGSILKLADFSRKSHGFLSREPGVTRIVASANFCSEGRVRPGTEAVPSSGTRGPSVGRNLIIRVAEAARDKSQNMLMYLMSMVFVVVGVTYASVPLYRRFCQATGFGGTVQERQTVDLSREIEDVPSARELVVHFSADVADSMPWKFIPCQSQVKVKVGQSVLAFYTAENTSMDSITGVSTYNVAPMQAGQYFTKIQCFCFEEQRLRPGEKIDMPVLFYVDPGFSTDPRMDTINSLILSYTFFKVDEEEGDT